MNIYDDKYYQNYYNVNDITDLKNEEKIQDNLVNVNEGFKRGNIFANLYWPYNKQTYNFVPKNDRQRLLIDIMQNGFYAHELNLYLDNFPDDRNKIKLYNEYRNREDKLINEYNMKYEPITLSSNKLNEVPWSWEDSLWPWEGV